MIEVILPACVAAAEAFGDHPEAELTPAERAVIGRAVPSRRREFATVRRCARLALAELGLPPAPILPGPAREPRWPVGVVGSMTHCDGYRAAALARQADLASLGIDAEPHQPLPAGLLPLIARPEELPMLTALAADRPGTHWDRLLFSIKESIYKAWFPLAGRWLGFEDATVTLAHRSASFEAVLRQAGPAVAGRPLTQVSGRWIVRGGLIVTAVAIGRAP